MHKLQKLEKKNKTLSADLIPILYIPHDWNFLHPSDFNTVNKPQTNQLIRWNIYITFQFLITQLSYKYSKLII